MKRCRGDGRSVYAAALHAVERDLRRSRQFAPYLA